MALGCSAGRTEGVTTSPVPKPGASRGRAGKRYLRLRIADAGHPPDGHLEVRVARLQVVLHRDQRAVAEPLGEHLGGQGALAARGRSGGWGIVGGMAWGHASGVRRVALIAQAAAHRLVLVVGGLAPPLPIRGRLPTPPRGLPNPPHQRNHHR